MENYFFDLGSLAIGEVVARHEDAARGPGWLVYRKPVSVLVAKHPFQVGRYLERACAHAERGWSAGFLSYEAAGALNPGFVVQKPRWPILAWFGLFESPPEFYRELVPVYDPVRTYNLTPEWNFEEYRANFDWVKQALAGGETYQVNLTFRQMLELGGTPAEFFSNRCGIDPPRYAAYINGGAWQVASFSPELMFERKAADVTAVPMKGTAAVGATASESAQAAEGMAADEKSIAENIMIVDMVRNDLGAVCATGTVSAPELLNVERHRNLLQMVSSVRGQFDGPTSTLVRALFPAASITGAPKRSTMRIIADLERSPRHIYCGAIGVMSPGHQRFSVAIRTARVWSRRREVLAEFGVGSGVVWDSRADAEYAECLRKSDFLMTPGTPWELVEALSGHDLDDAVKVGAHLDRLARSADELRIRLDRRALEEDLATLPREFESARPKIRIAVRRTGQMTISVVPSAIQADEITAVLARRPVASGDPNFRIKTNSRAVFDAHLDENPDVDEVLLYNERGELTEFCRGNLLIRLDGTLITPGPESGCLQGITVAGMVLRGHAAYGAPTIVDIARADEIWLVNSVVGLIRARITLRSGNPIEA